LPGLPYRLIESVGSCRAGTVWSAVDEQDRPATVAVLDGAIANEPGIRESFAAATAAFGQLRRGGLFADLRAATPWAACLSDGGPGAECVFLTMGLDYEPTQASPEAATPVSPWATAPLVEKPEAAAPRVTAPAPVGPEETQPETVALWPTTRPEPVSPAPGPRVAADPFTSPQPRIVPSPPRRRRTGLWIGVVVAVVILLAAGGTAIAFQGNGPRPAPSPHAQASTTSLPAAPAPQSPPAHPGLEPPAAGGWPAQWPTFKDTDGVRTYARLDGIDFLVKVPLS
jgi:hypothetical protein